MPEVGIPKYEKADNKERMKEITDRLEQGIQNLFESEKFKEYLNTMSKFHNYSFNNSLLIMLQKPDATHIAGFNSWKNQFNRQVKKGEKGIQILAPMSFKKTEEQQKRDDITGLPMTDRHGEPIMEEVEVTIPYFKPASVFDVSQTHGEPLPSLGVDELEGNVKDYDMFFNSLKEISPYPIAFEQMEDDKKGYCRHAPDKLIAINESMSEVQTVKTTIHEIAHATLHDRDLIKANLAEPKDRNTMEVEAEAVAYTVCQHYGIDTSDYSFAYIAEWGSGKETPELKSSLETIRSAANEIINNIDSKVLEITKGIVNENIVDISDVPNVPAPKAPVVSVPATPQKQSNIIGNTPYKDIAEKEYCKVDNKIAGEIQSALESQGIKFSGRVNKSTTTFTVDKSDVGKFRAIEKATTGRDVPAQAVETPANIPTEPPPPIETPKPTAPPKQSSIIGNTPYSKIEDKAFFNVDSAIASKIIVGLEEKGVNFSGKANDNNKTTFTLNKSDTDIFREVERAAVTPEKPLMEIIGNVKYSEIENKSFFKIDNALAVKVADELDSQNIKFSGRVNGDKTTFTLDKADTATFKETVKNVKAELKAPAVEQPPAVPATAPVEDARVAADQRPIPHMPEVDFKFEIFQISNQPENKNLRFATLKSLESQGLDVKADSYDLVYEAVGVSDGRIKKQILEDIYTKFNVDRPNDFKGHSLSVSDVVVMEMGGEHTAHYCDNRGFTELKEFGNIVVSQEQVHPPIYLETLRHAVETDGDKMLFHNSHKLNCECATAIDEAIKAHTTYGEMAGIQYVKADEAMKDVIEEYGAERVTAVTAHTVCKHDWDGRLSDQNKNWAKDIDIPKVDYIPLDTHLAIFDGFVSCVRKNHESEQEQPAEREQSADSLDIAVPPTPTVAELQKAVDNGEQISLMDLATALKSEKTANSAKQTDSPPSKRSIKERIAAGTKDKTASKSNIPEKSTQKNKSDMEH